GLKLAWKSKGAEYGTEETIEHLYFTFEKDRFDAYAPEDKEYYERGLRGPGSPRATKEEMKNKIAEYLKDGWKVRPNGY
ncbi:MAG: hypothetical protein ACRCV5_21705, partial [Afipia sp.]